MNSININRNEFQAFPYHMVEPSPWPILLSFSLLNLTVAAVMYMHGYPNGDTLLSLGLFLKYIKLQISWVRFTVRTVRRSCSSPSRGKYTCIVR